MTLHDENGTISGMGTGDNSNEHFSDEARADVRAEADRSEAVLHGRSDRESPASLSLDVGPKREVEGQMRKMSVDSRVTGHEIPRGTSIEGGGRYILAAMAIFVVGAVALLALIFWLVS